MLKKIAILVGFAGTALLTGCETASDLSVRPYSTPELFHPRTAIAKAMFDQTLNGQVGLSGPMDPMKPANNGTYNIFIYDKSPGTNQTMIWTYPNEVGTVTSKDKNPATLTIDRAKLEGLPSIEVWVKSRAAEGLSPAQAVQKNLCIRRSFAVTNAPPANGEGKPTKNNNANSPDSNNQPTIGFQVQAYLDTVQEFGQTFADCFYACEVGLSNPNPTNSLLLYSSSLRVRVRYMLSESDAKKLFGAAAMEHPELLPLLKDEKGQLQQYLDFKEWRRPMSYPDILAIFEFQKGGNQRQKIVEYTKSAGELATALIFLGGPAYAKGVAVFTGVFTKELEKQLLWDIALHSKNLESRSLQHIEEVTPAAPLHKLVFFPRRPIYGIIPKAPVYISELQTAETAVSADVTYVQKNAPVKTIQGNDPAP